MPEQVGLEAGSQCERAAAERANVLPPLVVATTAAAVLLGDAGN